MRAGRDELVVWAPLSEEFFGSPYEGWSTTKHAATLQDATVVADVMMLGSRPFPPGLALIGPDNEFANTVPVSGATQIRIGDQRWVDDMIYGLQAIIVDAFDIESLLVWIPNKCLDSNVQALVEAHDMTVIS